MVHLNAFTQASVVKARITIRPVSRHVIRREVWSTRDQHRDSRRSFKLNDLDL